MPRLCLATRRHAGGEVGCLWLCEAPLAVTDERDDPPAILSLWPDALLAVFARYAKPLATAAPPATVAETAIRFSSSSGASATVRAFAFRGYGDVLPSDYLLLSVDGQEPVCASASILASALVALARAATRARAATPADCA